MISRARALHARCSARRAHDCAPAEAPRAALGQQQAARLLCRLPRFHACPLFVALGDWCALVAHRHHVRRACIVSTVRPTARGHTEMCHAMARWADGTAHTVTAAHDAQNTERSTHDNTTKRVYEYATHTTSRLHAGFMFVVGSHLDRGCCTR